MGGEYPRLPWQLGIVYKTDHFPLEFESHGGISPACDLSGFEPWCCRFISERSAIAQTYTCCTNVSRTRCSINNPCPTVDTRHNSANHEKKAGNQGGDCSSDAADKEGTMHWHYNWTEMGGYCLNQLDTDYPFGDFFVNVPFPNQKPFADKVKLCLIKLFQ